MSLATPQPRDGVFPFQMDGAPVRGRLARVGFDALDPILRRHEYPRPVALLLGEALTLAALCGSLVKGAEKLTLQAEGDGPAPLLVAEWRAGGALRGYCRLGNGITAATEGRGRMAPWELIGQGAFALTLDPGRGLDPMQGIAPLEGASLAEGAESYFRQSEQTPTRLKVAVVEDLTDAHPRWRAGGMVIQRIAGDQARGFTEDDWARAEVLFATLEDAELADPDLSAERLLFRLFHEDRVRMSPPAALADACTCTAERLTGVLGRFSLEELAEFVEPDGLIHAKCQFCARGYVLAPEDVADRAG